MHNIDSKTVASFGDEWVRFDQSAMSEQEVDKIFADYFAIFPWTRLPPNSEGFDMGCGSGRWARRVAPRVGHLHCIDPSRALEIARRNLVQQENVTFHSASVDEQCLPAGSQDFGYSLGVLHHVPDTAAAIRSCAEMLKPGAPFLIYLYYAFDNRPALYRLAWRCTDLMRRCISRLPPKLKHLTTDVLGLMIYLPLARFARLVELLGLRVDNIPLSYYRKHSIYTMRTDSRDRFGTPLEQRFSKQEIRTMLTAAGLRDVCFSQFAPYWCAVGYKA